MSPIAESIILYVRQHPGCTMREIQDATGENYNRTRTIVMGAVDLGLFARERGVADRFTFKSDASGDVVVRLSLGDLHLMRHVLRWGIETGALGEASRDLLGRLETADKRSAVG